MSTHTITLGLSGLVIEEIVFPGVVGDYVRAVETAVRNNNGRKRARTLDVYDALRTIVEAHRIGAATTGRVDVGYRYPTDYVCCDAIRSVDGSVIWAVGVSRCGGKTVLGVSRIPLARRAKQIDTTGVRADGVIPAEIVAEIAAIMRPKELRKEEKR